MRREEDAEDIFGAEVEALAVFPVDDDIEPLEPLAARRAAFALDEAGSERSALA